MALALQSLSEVGTDDMCRELASEIAKLITNTTSLYIKKKAVLTATKILKQSPQSYPEYLNRLDSIMKDKNPSVM